MRRGNSRVWLLVNSALFGLGVAAVLAAESGALSGVFATGSLGAALTAVTYVSLRRVVVSVSEEGLKRTGLSRQVSEA